jgi:hypothetical protein
MHQLHQAACKTRRKSGRREELKVGRARHLLEAPSLRCCIRSETKVVVGKVYCISNPPAFPAPILLMGSARCESGHWDVCFLGSLLFWLRALLPPHCSACCRYERWEACVLQYTFLQPLPNKKASKAGHHTGQCSILKHQSGGKCSGPLYSHCSLGTLLLRCGLCYCFRSRHRLCYLEHLPCLSRLYRLLAVFGSRALHSGAMLYCMFDMISADKALIREKA